MSDSSELSAEVKALLGDLIASETSQNDGDAAAPGERPCPVCGEPMAIERDRGVTIDVCDRHGIWLDHGELAALLAQARSEDRARVRERIRAAKRDGKKSGALFGVWSLLWD